MKIFRLLAPCFKLKTNNVWLHYADLAVNCESTRFHNAHTLGVVFERDLLSRRARGARRRHIQEVVEGYLRPGPEEEGR